MKYFLLGFMFLLVSCSDQQIAGGSGTETTNGMHIRFGNQTAAKFAKISLITKSEVSPPFDSKDIQTLEFKTDSNGYFEFPDSLKEKIVNQEVFNFWIESANEVAFVNNIQDTIELSQALDVGFRFQDSLLVESIYILGSNKVGEVNKDGEFVLRAVPMGTFSIAIHTQKQELYQEVVEIKSNDLIEINELPPKGLILNDFNGATDVSPMNFLGKKFTHYIDSDSAHFDYINQDWVQGENTLGEEEFEGNSLITIRESDSSFQFSTHFVTVNPSFVSYATYGIDYFQESSSAGLNFETVDTLWLLIKGQGNLNIRLKQGEEQTSLESIYPLDLDIDFSWVGIDLESDFTSSPNWASIKNDIHRMEFEFLGVENVAENAMNFEIVEIRVSGPSSFNELLN